MLRAEWMRLCRRRDLWLGLVAVAILAFLTYVSGVTGGNAGLDLGPVAQPAAGRFAFPQSITSLLSSTQLVVVAVSAYAAAATTGAEFSYGTIRSSLLARSDRAPFILIRLLAMTGYAALLVLVVVMLGVVMPFAAAGIGVAVGDGLGAGTPGLGAAGSEMLFAMLGTSMATLVTLLVRNAAISLLLVTAYGAAEGLISGILGRATGGSLPVAQLLPVADMQLLAERALGAPTRPDLPTWLVASAGAVWIAVLWIACVLVLRLIDISE